MPERAQCIRKPVDLPINAHRAHVCTMFNNFLKTSLRSFTRQKGFSFINIGGLAIGIACFTLISLYVREELSYDRYHENADQIHRLGLHIFLDGTESNFATVAAPVAQGLKDNFPEVRAAARLSRGGFPVLRYQDKAFSEEQFYWADSTVFDVFTFSFIAGDPQTALTRPYTVVFTESMAMKYFGTTEALGKMVNMDNRNDYTVTGVIEDMPEASHFHADFLAAMATRENSRNTSWATQNNFNTYFVLDPGTTAEAFQAKLPALVETYVWPEVEQLFNASVQDVIAAGTEFEYLVTPLTDIHLKSQLRAEFETNGNIIYIWLFAGIAGAILLIACINYINLSTAISARKAKEVGVRKAVGSSRSQLIQQFLFDSVVLSAIAVVLSLFLVKIFLPILNTFAGKNLQFSPFSDPFILPGALVLALVVGLFAGAYPAFLLSSFDPVTVLKGSGTRSTIKSRLRNGLIVFQYAISAVLVLSSLIVYGQLEFIQNTNLGFSGEQVIVVNKTDDIAANIEAFKQKLRQHPSVLAVANSRTLFGQIQNDNLFRPVDQPESENKLIWLNTTDEDFDDAYQLEMVDGRYFSPDYPNDANSIVLNETAVRLLGLENPVGTTLKTSFADQELTIIGIVKNFHVESLQNDIKPFGFLYFGGRGAGRHTSVRVASDDFTSVLAMIEKEWLAISNGQAFEYEFFDKVFEEHYLAERKAGQILAVFSGLAILIACLGLFGLAAFVTTQRTKEIGIRKALGATATNIVALLFKDFGKWIVLANLIAWPVAYFVMHDWLQNFVYRTDIALWYFPASLLIGLMMAFITISGKTISAARANPVKALRYE